ncbi:SIMPL domain-containing protein [Thalassococcus sp. S3]|uniref:SIMPL domain-containing protein n=1 Tax=Thalassococcus sp. S3 TaxID=2017482 RepID=UPI00102444FF|nr:SIMPL domain-containing protein [Thalassococcus sp. S3]QBF32421.1 hypothetical protein CFI11_14530 [Thalassococcus sp. S3]
MTFLKFVLGAAMLAAASVAAAEPADRIISVVGEGQVDVAPDMATLTVGVTHEAEEASAAMAAVSDGVSQVIAQLEAQGVVATDMQTTGLSLNPVWSNRYNSSPDQPARITGFVARNAVTVRVRALDTLGGVLDAVISDGANDLSGLQFGMQEPEPLRDQARRLAVGDAIRKAELLAEAAGITLGPVQSMSESTGQVQPSMMMEMAAARDQSVPIAAGEVGMRASVNMVFSIAD